MTSKLNYLTGPFSSGKLLDNLKRGEKLPNYDLWKRVYDLGNKHSWKIVNIKTRLLERFHAMAVKCASGAFNKFEGKEDEGVIYSTRKREPKSMPVFEIKDPKSNTEVMENNIDNRTLPQNEMPTIEENNPPF